MNRQAADDVLDTAQRVLQALREAREAQNAARDAIDQANQDIQDAEGDLTMVHITFRFDAILVAESNG